MSSRLLRDLLRVRGFSPFHFYKHKQWLKSSIHKDVLNINKKNFTGIDVMNLIRTINNVSYNYNLSQLEEPRINNEDLKLFNRLSNHVQKLLSLSFVETSGRATVGYRIRSDQYRNLLQMTEVLPLIFPHHSDRFVGLVPIYFDFEFYENWSLLRSICGELLSFYGRDYLTQNLVEKYHGLDAYESVDNFLDLHQSHILLFIHNFECLYRSSNCKDILRDLRNFSLLPSARISVILTTSIEGLSDFIDRENVEKYSDHYPFLRSAMPLDSVRYPIYSLL